MTPVYYPEVVHIPTSGMTSCISRTRIAHRNKFLFSLGSLAIGNNIY